MQHLHLLLLLPQKIAVCVKHIVICMSWCFSDCRRAGSGMWNSRWSGVVPGTRVDVQTHRSNAHEWTLKPLSLCLHTCHWSVCLPLTATVYQSPVSTLVIGQSVFLSLLLCTNHMYPHLSLVSLSSSHCCCVPITCLHTCHWSVCLPLTATVYQSPVSTPVSYTHLTLPTKRIV